MLTVNEFGVIFTLTKILMFNQDKPTSLMIVAVLLPFMLKCFNKTFNAVIDTKIG